MDCLLDSTKWCQNKTKNKETEQKDLIFATHKHLGVYPHSKFSATNSLPSSAGVSISSAPSNEKQNQIHNIPQFAIFRNYRVEVFTFLGKDAYSNSSSE